MRCGARRFPDRSLCCAVVKRSNTQCLQSLYSSVRIRPAQPTSMSVLSDNAPACKDCPWRLSNRGKKTVGMVDGHRYGWYTIANLRRLWGGIRQPGNVMTCHPTDPRHAVMFGLKEIPEDTTPRECAGSIILRLREIVYLQRSGSLKEYRKAHPLGLTRNGAADVVTRMLLGGALSLKIGRPDLNDTDVQFELLGTWESKS